MPAKAVGDKEKKSGGAVQCLLLFEASHGVGREGVK